MRFSPVPVHRPNKEAAQISPWGGLVCAASLGFGGVGTRAQKCGLWAHHDKTGGFQRGATAPPWHTTLLARCSVLYLLARLTGENGRGFVTGREQKLSVFRERQQVYKVPTCKRKQQYYLFIIFPTFLIEIDIVPFGLFINSMYSELSKKSEGIVISIPVSVLILCFLPSRMA